MSKFSEIDEDLLQRAAETIGKYRDEGNPVAGDSPERWREIAHIAIRRIRSFERRELAGRDQSTLVRDIARCLVEQLEEEDPKLVGPLTIDYEELAERVLDVVAAAG